MRGNLLFGLLPAHMGTSECLPSLKHLDVSANFNLCGEVCAELLRKEGGQVMVAGTQVKVLGQGEIKVEPQESTKDALRARLGRRRSSRKKPISKQQKNRGSKQGIPSIRKTI